MTQDKTMADAYAAFYEDLLAHVSRLAQKHGLHAADFPAEVVADGLRIQALIQTQSPEAYWRSNYQSVGASLSLDVAWLDRWIRNPRTQRALQVLGLYRPASNTSVVLRDADGQVFLLKPGAVRFLVKENGLVA